MSHRLKTAREQIEIGDDIKKRDASIIDILQDVETASLIDSETVCESPLCDVSFPESGLPCKPKRFCSDECAQQASVIRRTAKLLENETDERVLEILRGKGKP
jgi:hypothetical protein